MSADGEKYNPESGDPNPVWIGDELDELPSMYLRSHDRIAGMSDMQTRLAALLCAVLLTGIACTGLLLGALDQSNEQLELSDCAQISKQSERLECFDRFAQQSVAAPFKGGSPFQTISNPEL